MSIIELVVLLLTVIVVGQLLYGWAAYAEKQLVLVRKGRRERVWRGKDLRESTMFGKLFPYLQESKVLHRI